MQPIKLSMVKDRGRYLIQMDIYFGGVCIGCARSEPEAFSDARKTLQRALRELTEFERSGHKNVATT